MKDKNLGGGLLVAVMFPALAIAARPTPALDFVDQSEARLDAPPSFSREIEVVDIDNDGDLDLIVAASGNTPEECVNTIHYNDGAGFFTVRDSGAYTASADSSRGLDIADLNGDGFLDIVEANRFQQDRVLWGSEDGSFVDMTEFVWSPEPGTRSRDIEIGDVDDDGDLDVNITRTANNPDRFYFNDGLGNLDQFIEYDYLPLKADTFDAELDDLDGDGDLDLVTVILGGSEFDPCEPTLRRNKGGGRFEDISWSHYEGPPIRGLDCELADFDADGDLDLFIATFPGDQDRILINHGGHRFVEEGEARLPATHFSAGSTTTGDVDGDGDIDIVVASATDDPLLRCLLNDGDGYFAEADPGPFPLLEGRPKDVVLADVDNDGDLDLTVVTGGTDLDAETEVLLINISDNEDLVPPAVLSVAYPRSTSVTNRAYPVTIAVRDNISLYPTAEILWNSGSGLQVAQMERIGGSLLRGFIPPQPKSTVIEYSIEVLDEAGNHGKWPADMHHQSFSILDEPPLSLDLQADHLGTMPEGSLQVSLTINNRTDFSQTVDAWAILSNGKGMEERIPAIDDVSISASSSIGLRARFDIPEGLETGSYAMTFVVGHYPLTWVDSKTLDFLARVRPGLD